MKNKTLTKTLSAILAVVMVLCSAPLSGSTEIELPDLFSVKAEAATASGSCGYKVNWSLDTSTGVLDITGTGPMRNYSSYSAPWYSYRSYVKTANIADGVTSIGEWAFGGCTSLTTVEIPDSVTSIGEWAFYNCDCFTSITIPDGVTSIGSSAFQDCTNATSVTIGDSVTSISSSTFYNCTNLTSVTIGDSVTSIGYSAFHSCTNLTSVTIPDSVTSIGSVAFNYCDSLTHVCYTGDIESWCGIEFVDAAATPMFYGGDFYIDGELLENLVIPSNVTEIKSYAFRGFECIKSVTIPESVTTIGESAFSGCKNITSVTYEGSESQWNEILIQSFNDYLVNAEITFLNGGHEHVYTSSVTTEPTCTKEGVKTFKCGCGDTYTESIPANGHTWTKWIVTEEPTETDNGFKVRTCKVCEDAGEVEVLPVTGSGEVDKTGITITLKDENGNVIIKEIVSDYDTDISFENGTYTLTISKENYVARTYTVTAADNMMSLDFSLNKVGDITGDGKVNTVDVARANSCAKSVSSLGEYEFSCADVTGDGKVNTIDVARINSHAKGVSLLW